MLLDATKIVDFYGKYYKPTVWAEQILFSEKQKLYLRFANEIDYIQTAVGTVKDEICVMCNLADIINLLKKADENTEVKFKNDKLMFSIKDKNIKFVLNVKASDSIPSNEQMKGTAIKIDVPRVNVANYFCGQEFPLNFVYYDESSNRVFATDGTRIYADFKFATATIAIPRITANFMATIPDCDFTYIKQHNLLYMNNNEITSCFSVYTPDTKIKPYVELVKANGTNCVVCNTAEFKEAFTSHLSYGANDIQLNFADKLCLLRSTNEKEAAVQTECASWGPNEHKMSFKLKDLQYLFANVFSAPTTNFAPHPDSANVFIVYDKDAFFAAI